MAFCSEAEHNSVFTLCWTYMFGHLNLRQPRCLRVGLTWQLALHAVRNPPLNSMSVSPKMISRPKLN